MQTIHNQPRYARGVHIKMGLLNLACMVIFGNLPADAHAEPLPALSTIGANRNYQSTISEQPCERTQSMCKDRHNWLTDLMSEKTQSHVAQKDNLLQGTLRNLSRFSFSIDERRRPMIHYLFYIDAPGSNETVGDLN